MKAILLCSLLLFLFVDDDGYYLSEFLFEILLCEMEWCGVCVERWWCVCVGRYFGRERERERESNMGGCSGRLRYLKKENLELMNKILTIKKR